MFLRELFPFYEKVPSPLDFVGCFKIFLPKHSVMFSTDFHQSLICSVTKKARIIAIKRDSSPENFLSYQRNRSPSVNALDKLRFSDSNSEQV